MDSVSWLKKLISFDTTSDLSNLPLINTVKDYLQQFSITSTLTYDASKQKANLFATIPAKDGNTKEGGLILSGHTDVVPTTNQDWQQNPYDAWIDAERLYGRGACDMKGFLAVLLAILPQLINLKLNYPIHLAFSYDEEVGCKGAPQIVAALQSDEINPRACIVGEPSNMRPVIAHKGIQAYSCKVNGKAVHSSLTPSGCNAIDYAAIVITLIRDKAERIKQAGIRDHHYDVPFSSISTNKIQGGTALNIIPELAEFYFEIRNLPEDRPDEIIDEIEQHIAKSVLPHAKEEFAEANIIIQKVAQAPAFSGREQGDLLKIARELTGEKETLKVAYATEAGLFYNAGIDTIICGPGSIEQAHRANEYVTLEQLGLAEKFLLDLVRKF